jgi:hypothetical protein
VNTRSLHPAAHKNPRAGAIEASLLDAVSLNIRSPLLIRVGGFSAFFWLCLPLYKGWRFCFLYSLVITLIHHLVQGFLPAFSIYKEQVFFSSAAGSEILARRPRNPVTFWL